jgi:hypothetical protein
MESSLTVFDDRLNRRCFPANLKLQPTAFRFSANGVVGLPHGSLWKSGARARLSVCNAPKR